MSAGHDVPKSLHRLIPRGHVYVVHAEMYVSPASSNVDVRDACPKDPLAVTPAAHSRPGLWVFVCLLYDRSCVHEGGDVFLYFLFIQSRGEIDH